MNARAAFGVYFTSSRIAKFLSQSVVAQSLSDREDLTRAMNKVVTASNDSIREAGANEVLDAIKSVRLADLTCGSGVFLIAALESLLSPYRKALEAQSRSGSLFQRVAASQQSEILKSSVYGADHLPAAVELAKLAL